MARRVGRDRERGARSSATLDVGRARRRGRRGIEIAPGRDQRIAVVPRDDGPGHSISVEWSTAIAELEPRNWSDDAGGGDVLARSSRIACPTGPKFDGARGARRRSPRRFPTTDVRLRGQGARGRGRQPVRSEIHLRFESFPRRVQRRPGLEDKWTRRARKASATRATPP